jgi:hypothetical protein
VERIILGEAVAATVVVFSIGGASPAAATGNIQVVGIEESLGDPTVRRSPTRSPRFRRAPTRSRIRRRPVVRGLGDGQSDSGHGRPSGAILQRPRRERGQSPCPCKCSGLSGAPLGEGGTADGKIYFDVVGDVPNKRRLQQRARGPAGLDSADPRRSRNRRIHRWRW